jgi:hypothetical protein
MLNIGAPNGVHPARFRQPFGNDLEEFRQIFGNKAKELRSEVLPKFFRGVHREKKIPAVK